MKNLVLAFLLLIISMVGLSQPGWQDFTSRYYYTLLDKSGKEIVFAGSSVYQIMINEKVYRPSEIPQEKLSLATPEYTYKHGFDVQVLINDFALAITEDDSLKPEEGVEVKIIRGIDTMFICQPSGEGSIGSGFQKLMNENGESSPQQNADFVLEFIPGRYYFPKWAKPLYEAMPKVSGDIIFVNFSQHNFLLTKEMYELVKSTDSRYRSNHEEADELVRRNFIEGYYSVERREEPVDLGKSLGPYKSPFWSGEFIPLSEEGKYAGLVHATMDSRNCWSSRNFFSILDPEENAIDVHLFSDEVRLSGTFGDLYVDSFNHVFYLPVWFKEKFNFYQTDCEGPRANKRVVYRSDDEGKTWKEDESLSELYVGHDFRELEILDHEYMLGYSRERKKRTVKGDYDEGSYYLIKNLEVVDVLKTPKDVHYNDNYNKYDYLPKKDTVFLGPWGIDPYKGIKGGCSLPMLLKSDEGWKFHVEEGRTSTWRYAQKKESKRKEYVNLELKDDKTLEFRNGYGSMVLPKHVFGTSSYWEGYHLLEREQEIYLVGATYFGHTYFSKDGGKSWYVYPAPLEKRNYNYKMVKVDENGVISHYNLGRGMMKILHEFELFEEKE